MNGDTGQTGTKPAAGVIILSAGMGSAGSGWYFNLTNELLKRTCGSDVRALRDAHNLSDILHTQNCSHDLQKKGEVDRLLALAEQGNTFTVKTHKPPSRIYKRLRREGRARATYIYRDPRDVVVSVFERGAKARRRGRRGAFARFQAVWQVIAWVRVRLLRVYDAWARCAGTHMVRFEDLRADPLGEMRRLATFLGVTVDDALLSEIIASYTGEAARQQTGSHYQVASGGGRRQDALTKRQRTWCNRLFRHHLMRMGYPQDEVAAHGTAPLESIRERIEHAKGD